VTDLQETKQALRHSKVQFHQLIEFSPAGILIADAHGMIQLANPALVSMLAASEELDLLGKELLSFCSPDKIADCRKGFGQVLSGKETTVRLQAWFRRLNNEDFPVEIDIGLFEWDGNPALQLMIRDCTERVQREEELQSQQDQLRQMQKMEAIGRLAGGVAHDFNNLLTAITGYSEMVLHGLGSADPLRSDVEQIIRAGEKAAALTRQLLVFSRKQALKQQVLNPNLVVTNMEKLLRRLIGESIDLVVLTDPEVGNIRADSGQIEQVIMNLAINARDAMPQGGKLTIETANVELSEEFTREHLNVIRGSYVMLAITDTGCGISKENLDKIWVPFFTTKSNGTGLGLAIVKKIVESHGGVIEVASEIDKGTTVKVFLPLAKP
jgi:two-component system cell cycle sensor histidine kinase/response regulator CckA